MNTFFYFKVIMNTKEDFIYILLDQKEYRVKPKCNK